MENNEFGFLQMPKAEAPQEHLPVAIVIDKSGSTSDIRQLLNECIRNLVERMRQDLVIRGMVELLVIHYSDHYTVTADFVPLMQIRPGTLEIRRSEGCTNTGEALLYALRRLDEKKQEWKDRAERYYQPLFYLLTDGYPDAGLHAAPEEKRKYEQDYARAAKSIRKREADKKLVFIAAGIQQKNSPYWANIEKLKELTLYPDRIVPISNGMEHMKQFEDFFNLIERSTNAMVECTSVQELMNQFWGIGSKVQDR